MLVLADWTGPTGAISSLVAAGAAIVAIIYAKQAAVAGRDAIREERELRIEQDYREFGAALWSVRQAADRASNQPDGSLEMRALRNSQEQLQTAFVMPRWVDLGQNAPQMMDKLLDLTASPADAKRHASLMTAQLQHAWDERMAQRATGRGA